MKKIYVKPTIEVELAEAGELMTGSNPGNGQANYGDEVYNESIDAVDGDFSDAKGGSFTCWEDEGDWAL